MVDAPDQLLLKAKVAQFPRNRAASVPLCPPFCWGQLHGYQDLYTEGSVR